MTGLIYKATNTKTNKAYVGQTTLPLQKRINGHYSDARCKKTSMHFHRAIKRYGEDVFIWEILENNIPVDALGDKEIRYIEKYNTFIDGYNLSPGGATNRGWKASPETIQNMKNAQKGRTFTAEAKQKMSKAQSGVKSHKFSPWYIYHPDKGMQIFFTTTVKEFAKYSKVPYTSISQRFNKVPNRGRFKNCVFGHTKELIWNITIQKNTLCWTQTFSY